MRAAHANTRGMRHPPCSGKRLVWRWQSPGPEERGMARARSTYVYRRLGGGKSRRFAVFQIVADGRSGHRLLERSPTPVAYPVWFAKPSLQLARMRSSFATPSMAALAIKAGSGARATPRTLLLRVGGGYDARAAAAAGAGLGEVVGADL